MRAVCVPVPDRRASVESPRRRSVQLYAPSVAPDVPRVVLCEPAEGELFQVAFPERQLDGMLGTVHYHALAFLDEPFDVELTEVCHRAQAQFLVGQVMSDEVQFVGEELLEASLEGIMQVTKVHLLPLRQCI